MIKKIFVCGLMMVSLTILPNNPLLSDPVDMASKPAVPHDHARNTLVV